MENIRVYSHSACLSKENGDGHPERKERLESIMVSLRSLDTLNIDFKEAPLAEYKDINRVHPQSYLDEIFEMIPDEGLVGVEKEPYADTLLCQNSKEAILRACGAGIGASLDLMSGNFKRLFCAIRPPGHHAEKNKAMGFCIYNNVAIAARYAQQRYGLQRILIVDFDVHHGNGTQAVFESDPSLFFGSSHQMPAFPGTGHETETGVGNIVNVPLAPGSGSEEFRRAYSDKILPALRAFEPDFIMISAGFDADARDPLAQLRVKTPDFAWVTAEILKVADEFCSGKAVSTLEGGYDLDALAAGVAVHMRELMGI